MAGRLGMGGRPPPLPPPHPHRAVNFSRLVVFLVAFTTYIFTCSNGDGGVLVGSASPLVAGRMGGRRVGGGGAYPLVAGLVGGPPPPPPPPPPPAPPLRAVRGRGRGRGPWAWAAPHPS